MRTLMSTLAVVAAAAAGLTSTAALSHAAAGVCAGVAHCDAVAHIDVDGDFEKDTVGLQSTGAHHVVVRVLTHEGDLLTRRLALGPGKVAKRWGGGADIDGDLGSELVVLTTRGSHNPGYTVVTFRHGHLAIERSPYGPLRWFAGAAGVDRLGWHRFETDIGLTRMTGTEAVRNGHGTYAGPSRVYVWRKGTWVLHSTTTVHYGSARSAAHSAGFHVRGLARFPAVS